MTYNMVNCGGIAAMIGVVALLALGGCADALTPTVTPKQDDVNYYPQSYSGISHGTFNLKEGTGTFYDGKERGNVAVAVTSPDGATLTYSASDVAAFNGVALRAEVEKVISENRTETVGKVADAVVSLFEAYMGFPGAGVLEGE